MNDDWKTYRDRKELSVDAAAICFGAIGLIIVIGIVTLAYARYIAQLL